MANAMRMFQFRYSAERDLQDLYLKMSIGASGAPTIVNGKGIVSVTRNSAGRYTIVLKSNYNLFLSASASQIIATTGISAAPIMSAVSEQVASVTSPSLVVQFSDYAGVAADMASGEIATIHLLMRSAST